MAIAAQRFNNPGNVSLPIRGWTGGGTIVGIKGQPGYASFPDMATGVAAFQKRVSNRVDEGYNTIRKLNPIYAEDINWKSGVSRLSGVGVDDPITSQNINQVMGGIIHQETGRSAASQGINLGGDPPLIGYVDPDNPQTLVGGGTVEKSPAGALSWANSKEELAVADANGDGNVTVTELKEYNANQTAAKTASGASAGGAGNPSDVPTAIVTAGNQQANATVTAAKTVAAGATADTMSSNASDQGIFQGALSWLGGRVLQIMVFILAAIFILVGLYFFAPKTVQMLPASA